MPYILSPLITEDAPGMWSEGKAYEREQIYAIDGSAPPVNYSKHIMKSHSLTHVEGSLHTQREGKSVDEYFQGNFFHGMARVIRLKGDGYKLIDKEKGIYHWEVTKAE